MSTSIEDSTNDSGSLKNHDGVSRTLTTALEFTDAEEKALVRKLDSRILPPIVLLYIFACVDRINIGNAKIAGLEKDVGLHGQQFNLGLTAFFLVYAAADLPSNLLLKRVGADRWLPAATVAFGLACCSTAFIVNPSGFYVTRIALALAEGGIFPGCTYYLSTFYPRHELVFRLGILGLGLPLSGAFSALISSGLLKIHHFPRLPMGRWRNIFVVEGVITIAIGLAASFLLPRMPQTASFLTPRQREIAAERLRDDSGGLVKAEETQLTLIFRALKNVNTMVSAVAFFCGALCAQGTSLFMPTLLTGLGYSATEANWLCAPPFLFSACMVLLVTRLSQITQKRGIWAIMSLQLSIAGSLMLIISSNKKVGYAAIFLVISMMPSGLIFLSWATSNAAPYTARATASAVVLSIGSLGPLVSSWIYLPSNGPRYLTAMSIQLAAQLVMVCCAVILMVYNTRENRIRKAGGRDHRLQADPSVVANLGHLHPSFHLST